MKTIEEQMGHKKLNVIWAKVEIFLGLTCAVIGLIDIVHQNALFKDLGLSDFPAATLMILGLYLAGAGHRSHIYISQNKQTQFFKDLLV